MHAFDRRTDGHFACGTDRPAFNAARKKSFPSDPFGGERVKYLCPSSKCSHHTYFFTSVLLPQTKQIWWKSSFNFLFLHFLRKIFNSFNFSNFSFFVSSVSATDSKFDENRRTRGILFCIWRFQSVKPLVSMRSTQGDILSYDIIGTYLTLLCHFSDNCAWKLADY